MKNNYTLLYVDDEPVNRMVFDKLFNKHFHILTAASGKEGLQKINESETIQVIISDLRMPGMSGLEFLADAKKIKQDLKCFILTAFDFGEEIQTAINDKLIVKSFKKPYDAQDIISSVETTVVDPQSIR